jgi:hypothetical protein
VRSVGVVVGPPFFDDLARLFETGEQVLVEALVAQASVRLGLMLERQSIKLNRKKLYRLSRPRVERNLAARIHRAGSFPSADRAYRASQVPPA